ncbi:MAG: glycosyltransferase family 25 protein [Limnohabitans sp.]
MQNQDKLLTLVINLDRSPLRLERMAQQLKDISWPWQRLPAVDGNKLSMDDSSLIDVDSFRRKHGKMPLPGELGCYLSHVQAMRSFLDTDKDFVLIMEDDLRIGPDLPAVVDALLAQASQWDMVMLSGIHSASKLPLRTLTGKYRLAVSLIRYAGASCYLVNRHAATVYVDGLLPMSLPYDHEYDRAWAWRLKCRAVVPAPCRHSFEDGSDLHPSGVIRNNFHWTKRMSTYGWRIKTDLRRLVHGLAQWLMYRS